ncbi:prostate stem cell antigen-like [Astyanax mexicanus]|uniref:Prostate stem cell antigen-like n=1 Tax=Astyanax mexicanus TaxID=7994 RepID=A0A8T2KS01_ASTMX|nr:prostate stem cell antigen-like [Astyanax mexicanus]
MSPWSPLLQGLSLGCLFSLLPLLIPQVDGLQCYACNIVQGQRYVDVGCSSPEVITCSHSHKGFKQRFCIRTESITLGIVLTSGCATSHHCHTEELPGVKIHCCDSDLCNSASSWHISSLQALCSLTVTLAVVWLHL